MQSCKPFNSNWVRCLFFCISKVALLGKIATKIRSFSGLNFITNFIIESYEEKISATYRLSDEESSLRRRAMFDVLFRVLQCTPPGPNPLFQTGVLKSMDWRTKDICIDEQHMQKRKQCIPYVNWTYQQTVARIRSAVSPSSSGECCSCFERFSARSFQKNNLFQDQFLLIPPGVQVFMAPDLCQVSRRQCVWFLNSNKVCFNFRNRWQWCICDLQIHHTWFSIARNIYRLVWKEPRITQCILPSWFQMHKQGLFTDLLHAWYFLDTKNTGQVEI